jgi:hypothetical protein
MSPITKDAIKKETIMSNQENKTVYFDLHATGAGYIKDL